MKQPNIYQAQYIYLMMHSYNCLCYLQIVALSAGYVWVFFLNNHACYEAAGLHSFVTVLSTLLIMKDKKCHNYQAFQFIIKKLV